MARHYVCSILLYLLIGASSQPAFSAPAQDKSPMPPAEAQAKALALVKEVYGQEWEAAKTSAQKQALAAKLLQKATETTDATDRYVLLDVARGMAAQAGDAELAIKAIEAMSARYEVDAYRLKGAALAQAAKEASSAQSVAVAKLSLALIDEAVGRDDFVAAKYLGNIAVDAARKGRDTALAKDIVARNREIEEIGQAFAEIQDAWATLKQLPVDPDANLAVGRYYCLIKGNWNRGLPMLALGSDSDLKELAVKELEGATDAAGQVALGDGWWDLAGASEGVAQKQLQGRAAHWYRKALPALSGLVKDKVAGRVDSVQPEEQPHLSNAKTSVPEHIVKAQRSKSPAHSKSYRFIDETAIRSDWTLTHGWRIEGEGLRLLNGRGTGDGGTIVSSDQYTGDFILDVALKETHQHFYTDVVFGLCGEDVEIRIESSEVIRLQRTGDTLFLGRAGRPASQIKIKQTHLDKPTRLRIQLVWQWGSGGGFWVTAVGFIGSNEPSR